MEDIPDVPVEDQKSKWFQSDIPNYIFHLEKNGGDSLIQRPDISVTTDITKRDIFVTYKAVGVMTHKYIKVGGIK